MNWYHFKIAIRNTKRKGWLSIINWLGLSIGMTAVVLIVSYVNIELKKGKYLPDYEYVYNLQQENGGWMSNPMIETFRNNIPELSNLTAFREAWMNHAKFTYAENDYFIEDFIYADSLFFKVFNYKCIYGDTKNALCNANSVVLTQTVAEKIFGKINPVGQQILLKTTNLETNLFYTVKAVIQDMPRNAILKFNGIFSLHTLNKYSWFKQNQKHWGACNYVSYFSSKDAHSHPELIKNINKTFASYAPRWIRKDVRTFTVKQFSDLYLDNETKDGLKQGSLLLIKMISLMGLLILLVSWINFVNILVAKHESKKQNLSIHKILGARPVNLIQKSLYEVIPGLTISLVTSLLFSALLLPVFQKITNTSITNADLISSPVIILFVLSIVGCGLFLGLKHNLRMRNDLDRSTKIKLSKSKNSLLIVQFTVSIAFVLLTFSMIKQFRYMQDKPLGFNKENVVYLDMQGMQSDKHQIFKDELMRISRIQDITFASSVLGKVYNGHGRTLKNKGRSKRIHYNSVSVDKNFFNFYNIDLIEGQNFTDISYKQRQHIFNETAIKSFEIEKLKDARVTSFTGARGDVIGIVKDFNYQELSSPIQNLGFMYEPPGNLNYLFIKTTPMSSLDMKSFISEIKSTWKEFVPDWPLNYNFQDSAIKEQYESELRFS
ncbi:MAG: ABC transporter permease, partial [Bacteroidales bacterium]|nr:ABC transporter permease [Bacteroidales bacterium]